MTWNSVRALLFGLTIATAASLAVGTARANVQTPIATACPAAFDLLPVDGFEAQAPYKLPRLVDTAGNQDGFVCALALPDAARDADCRTGGQIACILAQLGLPLYHFVDNDNPANKRAQAGG
jgi:hypothetical protein